MTAAQLVRLYLVLAWVWLQLAFDLFAVLVRRACR